MFPIVLTRHAFERYWERHEFSVHPEDAYERLRALLPGATWSGMRCRKNGNPIARVGDVLLVCKLVNEHGRKHYVVTTVLPKDAEEATARATKGQ